MRSPRKWVLIEKKGPRTEPDGSPTLKWRTEGRRGERRGGEGWGGEMEGAASGARGTRRKGSFLLSFPLLSPKIPHFINPWQPFHGSP